MRPDVRQLLILAGAAWGCADASAPAVERDLLPSRLLLVAEAHAVDADGLRIDCAVATHVTLQARVDRPSGRVIQYGAGGGEASRYRDVNAERAVQFWADTYFATLEFHLIGTDSIAVRSPESEAVTERFWHEFAVWAGSRSQADPSSGALASGPWTCQPMDTPPSSGEYYDAEGTAPGSWSLRRDPAAQGVSDSR
ncbi:MAG: hypothetical protein ACREMN_08095 [Gemmatimonadales bacterium]